MDDLLNKYQISAAQETNRERKSSSASGETVVGLQGGSDQTRVGLERTGGLEAKTALWGRGSRLQHQILGLMQETGGA